jgi:formate-dependent nitrite reductase membrane component NrfD
MKYRLLAAVVCTAFSFMAIKLTFIMKSPLFILFIAAWAAYLLILFFWVRSNRAPRALLIAGTLLGVVSVLVSFFTGLLLAFPAIALMLHVIWCSFRAATPDIAVKRDDFEIEVLK